MLHGGIGYTENRKYPINNTLYFYLIQMNFLEKEHHQRKEKWLMKDDNLTE